MIRQAALIVGTALVVCLVAEGLSWLLWPAVPFLAALLGLILIVGLIAHERS